jgi:DNA-directed RNA polymerase subunit RPC12/RpoP
MLEVEEYDLSETPIRLTEDDVISPGEAKYFRRQLRKIAGKNPHGGNILELRWGVTYEDPMLSEPEIKYVDFERFGRKYGERRWIIEIWRSTEFLKRSGRYNQVFDQDRVQEFYFCVACDAEIKASRETLEMLGSTPPCESCGSKRSYTREIREMSEGRLLKDFPVQGCYDYWLRLERANLTYHPLNREALKICRALWEWEQTPLNERNAIEQADRELERRQMVLAQRQQSGRTPQFSSGLILPAHLR